MITKLADLVNFNADASCLPAEDWLGALEGGEHSLLCRWLEGFLRYERRVTLGLVGATVADMAVLNPESIAIVNRNPELFEVVLRPFSHDIGLLRRPEGFALNFELGRSVITSEFEQVTPWLLAPEFMLTNEQSAELARRGIAGTFINPGRFAGPVAARIPRRPYRLHGLFDTRLDCIPVLPELTNAYLNALHDWDCEAWNTGLREASDEVLCSWRDGESWLLLPEGLAREHAWLAGESDGVERIFVRELVAETKFEEQQPDASGACTRYPVHSFADWVGEFRMFGFLRRLMDLERRLDSLSRQERLCWLQAANSDVLSAVEKDSPRVRIRTRPAKAPGGERIEWEIRRSERGFEGEEYLAIAERHSASRAVRDYVDTSPRPHIRKLRARLDYFGAEQLAAVELA